MRKHILYFVLVFCFVLGFAPATAHAEEVEKTYTYLNGTPGTNDNEGPDKLFDGESDTKWCVTDFENAYIIFSTKTPVNVNGYAITTGGDSNTNRGRNPRDWTLYGCNDYNQETGSGSWYEIHNVINDTVLEDTSATPYNFAFDGNDKLYQYYKLEITALQGSDVMQMSEFELTCCEHKWNALKTTYRTCTTAGYIERTCSKCNGTKITDMQNPYGHNFSGENGKCTRCDKTREELYSFDIEACK